MKYPLLCSLLLFVSTQLLAADDGADSCIGVSRLLEVFHDQIGDEEKAEFYRRAKNMAIDQENRSNMRVIGIIMETMTEAVQLREVGGLSADETRSRYEADFDARCRDRFAPDPY